MQKQHGHLCSPLWSRGPREQSGLETGSAGTVGVCGHTAAAPAATEPPGESLAWAEALLGLKQTVQVLNVTQCLARVLAKFLPRRSGARGISWEPQKRPGESLQWAGLWEGVLGRLPTSLPPYLEPIHSDQTGGEASPNATPGPEARRVAEGQGLL